MGSWKEMLAFSDLRDRWPKPVVLTLECAVDSWRLLKSVFIKTQIAGGSDSIELVIPRVHISSFQVIWTFLVWRLHYGKHWLKTKQEWDKCILQFSFIKKRSSVDPSFAILNYRNILTLHRGDIKNIVLDRQCNLESNVWGWQLLIDILITIVPLYLWGIVSRAPCRYQNLKMFKSLINNGLVFTYILLISSHILWIISRLLVTPNTV